MYWRRDGLPVLVADSETLPCDQIPYSLGKNSSSQYTCKTCGIPHTHQSETATGDAGRYKLQPRLHTNPTPIQDRQLAGLNRGWHVAAAATMYDRHSPQQGSTITVTRTRLGLGNTAGRRLWRRRTYVLGKWAHGGGSPPSRGACLSKYKVRARRGQRQEEDGMQWLNPPGLKFPNTHSS